MIGYGLAFVIGYFFALAVRMYDNQASYPWSWQLVEWGLTFVVLNYLAGLW